MKRKLFAVRKPGIDVEIALLVIRVVMGIAFIHHGWGKIQNPFHWMGPEAPVPAVLQFLAALSEVGGGIGLIAGLLTRLCSFGLTCTMVVAVATHRFGMGDPFVSPDGGRSYELAAVYLTISFLLLLLGPGRLSLDRVFFGASSK